MKSLSPLLASVALCALFSLHPLTADAAGLTEITIEQVSAAEYGDWFLLYGGSQTLRSTTRGVDAKRHTVRPREGNMTLLVAPPVGAGVRILLFGSDNRLVQTVEGRQITFHAEAGNYYRLQVQHLFLQQGLLGITSSPNGLPLTIRTPNGATLTGRTPFSLPNAPVGSYQIQVEEQGDCIKPRPYMRRVNKNERTVLHVQLECGGVRETDSNAMKPLVSRRALIDAVNAREQARINRLRNAR